MLSLEQMNAITTVGEAVVLNLNFNAAKRRAKQFKIQARWKRIEGEFRKNEISEQTFQAAAAQNLATRGKGFQGGDSVQSLVSKYAKAEHQKRQVDLATNAAVVNLQSQGASVLADAGLKGLQAGLKVGINSAKRNEQAKITSPLSTGPKPTGNATSSALGGDALKALTGG